MDNKMKNLESFYNRINKNAFSGSRIEPYLKSIEGRIDYQKYLDSDGTDYSQKPEELAQYIEEPLTREKVLPFDELICIEDENSAVIIENHPEKENTVLITTYEEDDTASILLYGELEYMEFNTSRNIMTLAAKDIYGAFIIGDRTQEVTLIAGPTNIGEDLYHSFVTVLHQLKYLEKTNQMDMMHTTDKS